MLSYVNRKSRPFHKNLNTKANTTNAVSIHTAGRVYRFSRYMHTANYLTKFLTYLTLTTAGFRYFKYSSGGIARVFLSKTWTGWLEFEA